MKTRKKLIPILFVITAMLIATTSKAQPQLSYDSNSKNFSITAPTIDSQIIQGRTPFSKVLLETGTGAFFIFQTQGRLQESFTQAWHYKATTTTQPIMQIAVFYDTIKPPKGLLAFAFSPSISFGNNSTQTLLSSGQYVKLTNCIGDTIIPNDTTTLVITYKNTVSAIDGCTFNQSVIALFYNNTDNTSLFAQVPTDNTTYSFDGTPVKPLRKHNGETVEVLSNLPSAIQSILNSNGSGFSQALYLTTPYTTNSLEKNIFLSMVPNPDSTSYQSQSGTVKAVIIDYMSGNPSSCNSVSSFTQNYEISFRSRDPNSVTITPDYFPALSSAIRKPVNYKIHFENEGMGRANRILITASIPKGIQMPSEMGDIFTCKIGNDDIDVVNEKSLTRPGERNPRICVYRIDPESRKITFTITNANLSGKVGLKGKNNIGEIGFRLTTSSRKKLFKSMLSTVSIVFDDNRAETSSALIKID